MRNASSSNFIWIRSIIEFQIDEQTFCLDYVYNLTGYDTFIFKRWDSSDLNYKNRLTRARFHHIFKRYTRCIHFGYELMFL